MNPAMSVVVFTAIAGAAQGLVVALALATLAGIGMARGFVAGALLLAAAMAVVGLLSSFGHLGRKERAWRAVLMWRTSWLSRECLVLPAFIGWTLLWWALLPASGAAPVWLPLGALLLAALLWLCTAMIYACLRFIQEWAHPLTVVNYTLIGLSSGLVLAGAAGVLAGQREFVGALSGWTVAATLAAWLGRALALRRNAALKPRSTLQSATGIHNPQLVQRAMGMTGGSFNTREFFHRASLQAVRRTRVGFQLLAFAAPLVLVCMAMLGAGTGWWLVALPVQSAGLLAERWFFFAQARHPQNLYYQVVS